MDTKWQKPLFFAAITGAIFAGLAECILTGGESGWIPLVAGVVGAFVYLQFASRDWWPLSFRLPWRLSKHPEVDLFVHVSCVQVACLCAEVDYHDNVIGEPAVLEWVNKLRANRFGYPVDKGTRLTVGEWLNIVRYVCDERDEPLPTYFHTIWQEIQKSMRS